MNAITARSFASARPLLTVVTLATFGVSACSGGSSAEDTDPVATASGETGEARITIADFAFGEPLTVTPGTTVSVVNDDGTAHTLTADDGSFDTGVIDAGENAEVTLDDAGEFSFFCEIHTSMTGSVTVEA